MFWADRVNRVAGATLILLAVLIILSIAFSFAVSDANPFERDEIDDVLVDINDNEAAAVLSVVFGLATDAAISLAAAAGLYLVFRDRSRFLALVGLVSILAASAAFIAADAGNFTMVFLAQDFAEGGPGGIAAGDAAILETARAVAIAAALTEQIAGTALGFGILAFGSLIAWAPAGTAVAPPRWLGGLGVLGGLAFIASWLIAATEAAFVLFIIAAVATLLWLLILGWWLLTQAPDDGAASPLPRAA